jgi:hypothetical protein
VIFKQLIETHSWEEVKATLESLYPNDHADIPAYETVFATLQQLEAEASDLRLTIEEIDDPFTSDSMASVVGENDQHSYAIEFMKWEQWLGMEVKQSTLQEYTELEIISHSLWEMTFVGYSQEAITTWVNERVRRKAQERKAARPIEELWDELRLEDND